MCSPENQKSENTFTTSFFFFFSHRPLFHAEHYEKIEQWRTPPRKRAG